ncbi:shikimate dehydrogenase [Mariprofundus aestuarium]|uniref:Shikimate dehydrogenase (NADP(+)) n=1 Tax=Mariprofundus aestuarium TaxID=1921086 RepID=A0A2K8L3T8_MARES|nr:shikimate dehydrogenase [Mariprofundus aestuarium]ATX78906.1 shikimate dehydrogenase [Mariprofundus aestuarium]
MEINGSTKLYGIIGWPVKHSLSPVFQASFLEQLQINAAYLPFAVAPDLLNQALEGLFALGVEGFNVTVPHKESVFQRVSADDDARLIGAVNTVRRGVNGWDATNTDWRGFKAVVEGLETPVRGKRALLFGAGGTARAVLHALAALGLDTVYICNRNSERLAGFVEFAHTNYPQLVCEPVSWEQKSVTAACADAVLLVNTTTIGLAPEQQFPFALSGAGAAIDAVYKPDGDTAFCRAAEGSRSAVDGLPMLIAQGAESFAWWHGCTRPNCISALSSIEKHLGRTPVKLPGWQAN